MYRKSINRSIGRRIIASFVFLASLLNSGIVPIQYAYAQELFQLPAPGTRISLSPAFSPAILQGVKVYPNNPFRIDFILDKGNFMASTDQLKAESTRLIKYFLASVTVPENDLWVNLSPYEEDRIIPEAFSETEMGRDLLAQDYILKQLTASLMHPQGPVGKEFWQKVYEEAQKQYGSTDIAVDTFHKVWIIPDKAIVYESREGAYVLESRLKVMLEEDYLALTKNTDNLLRDESKETSSSLETEIMKSIVLPVLETEVNEGRHFAQLRQIYQSLILAIWFKDKIQESIFGHMYVNQKKTEGIDIADKDAKEKIWAQYVETFKKGIYNFIQEEVDIATGQRIPRKYFSGGAGLNQIRGVYQTSLNPQDVPQGIVHHAHIVEIEMEFLEASHTKRKDSSQDVLHHLAKGSSVSPKTLDNHLLTITSSNQIYKFQEQDIVVEKDIVANRYMEVQGQFITMNPQEVEVKVSVEPEMVNRDLNDRPVREGQTDGTGRSVEQVVNDSTTPRRDDILMVFNGITGNFYEANSAVLIDGKLIVKGRNVDGTLTGTNPKAVHQKEYRPLDGTFWFLPFHPVAGEVDVQKAVIKNGVLETDLGQQDGIFGAVIIRDGRSTLLQGENIGNEYIHFGISEQLQGHDINAPRNKRMAMSAMGYTEDGKLFRASLIGDPNDPKKNEPNIDEFVDYLLQKRVKSAILMGTVADVKGYIKEAPELATQAIERFGVLSRAILQNSAQTKGNALTSDEVDQLFHLIEQKGAFADAYRGTLNKFTSQLKPFIENEFGQDALRIFAAMEATCGQSFLGNVFEGRPRPNATHVIVYSQHEERDALKEFLFPFMSRDSSQDMGRLSENSPEERFRRQYRAIYPDREDLYEEAPVHRQGNYRRLYDAIAGLFGIDASDDNQRLNEGKRLLELLDHQGDKTLIVDAISHLGAYTYVASGAHRLTPIALAIKNHFLGKNLFSSDGVEGLVDLDPEFRWLRTTHPFYAMPGTYEEVSGNILPQLNFPLPAPKKVYRTLDIGAAPKSNGSITQNLMRRFFDRDNDLKGRDFEIFATDIFFPIFEEKNGRVQKRVDADLPEKIINGVHYYDALRFSSNGEYVADVMSGDFNRHGELGRFDYITMTATFHHLAQIKGEVFEDLPLADVVLEHPDGAPFEEKYFMARTQQKVLTNLLNSLEKGGILFLNLTFSKTPEAQYGMTKDQVERHMMQHFMARSNADNYIVIRRETDRFIVYDEVISYRPSGEKEGTEDSLLRGEVGFYTKVKISNTYPGLVLDDENYKKVRTILRQADIQVFWHQGLNKSRWGRVMAAAKAIERGASFPEWLAVYMSNVPSSDIKKKIIENAKDLHQELMTLSPVQANNQIRREKPLERDLFNVDGFDGFLKINERTGRIYFGDRSKAVKFNMPVFTVRHGESVAQTLRGTKQPGHWSQEEIDRLSSLGQAQVNRLAPDLFEIMKAKGVFDEDFIVLTSGLVRAQQTAGPFIKFTQEKLGKPIVTEKIELANEIDHGLRGFSIDFLTPEVIRIRDEVSSLNAMAKLSKGESFIDLLNRARKFVLFVNEHYNGQKVILFTHSLFMNALQIVQGEGDWETEDGEFIDWNKHKADNAELWSFEPAGISDNAQVLDKAQKSQEEKADSLGFKVIDHDMGHITYGENFKPFDLNGIELVIVPHGLTDGDIEGVLQVSKDVDDPRFQLNAEGWRQVEHGAEVIWDEYGERIKAGQVVFYRSGTRRTAQTAEAFIKYANSKAQEVVKDVRISDAIRMNLGAWEGSTKAQIDTVLSPDERNRARQFIKRNALIGPKDGQTYVEYLSDVRDLLNSIKNEHNGKTVVVFGHGIFIKTVKVLLQTRDIIATPFLDWNSGGGSSYKLGMPLVMNDLPRKGQGSKNGISAWRKDNTRGHSVEELAAYAASVRLEGLKIWRKMKGPLSGAMSPSDLYTVLLMDYVDREQFVSKHPQRLRVIPKGTAGNTFYSAAAYAGLVESDRVSNIKKDDLEIVPTRFGLSEVSLYKMGTSLEQGIGLALASKIKQVDYPVIVFLTDGGLQLGIDHQAKFAAHMELNNLTVVVDVNRLQNAYRVEDVDPTLELDANGHLSRLTALWEAYGWDVVEVDGHDFQQIRMAYDKIGQGQKPLVILAKTTKGRGMTEIEDRLNFSHKFPSEEDYQKALAALQGTTDEYRIGGYDIKYPEWVPVQRMAFDNQGFALPRYDLTINEDPMQFERSLSDQGKLHLEKVLKSWLQEFISANPNQVFIINTDNPSPFEISTPVRSPTNQSPFIFVGINERFALNLAGGMFLEGLAPIYIGPAAHMPINAEDWKLLGLDKQNVLVVARSSGSALSYWGPGHLVYEDIELFKNSWSQVLQPASAQDLILILENYYRSYPNGKPSYLRMQEVYPFDLPVTLFDTEDKRREIFKDGFYLADSFEGEGDPVVFVVSGKTVKEAVDAGRDLRKAGISYKVINVLNLSAINNEKFGALSKGASRIVTAIDALPQSLSLLVLDALPEQRSNVMAFGVKDGGSSAPETEIFAQNRIDVQSFVNLGVRENAIRLVVSEVLDKLADTEDSKLIRDSWDQALKDFDNSVINNLIKVYLFAGREVGDRLVHIMIGLGEDVSDPWTANYLISDVVSLFGVKLLGRDTASLRAIVRDHEVKSVSLGSVALFEEVPIVNETMSLSELREAVRSFKSQQQVAVLSKNDYKEIAKNVQVRNIRFMQRIIPILIRKIWQEFGVDRNSSAILYFNDIKTAASDLDIVYVGPDKSNVDRRLTELCNLLGIKRDLSAVILINQALSEGRGRNLSGYQYGGNIEAISINGGDFNGFYQANLKLENPEAARKMHEDRLRYDLLKKWDADVEKRTFKIENLKSVYGAAVNDLLKSFVFKFGLSYGVYDEKFWVGLGRYLALEDLAFLRKTYELINQARNLTQYVTERRWDVADDRVADVVGRLLTQQGVPDYRQAILTAKQRIDVLMEQYFKEEPGVIADKYQGRADKNWDAIASLYDLIIKDRIVDFAQGRTPGGIDLTRDKINIQMRGDGNSVEFNFDPVMIQQLQNSSGLTPVIIDIRPMNTSVLMFLGLRDNANEWGSVY